MNTTAPEQMDDDAAGGPRRANGEPGAAPGRACQAAVFLLCGG
eukprot:gene11341-biopygen4436